MQNLWTIFCYVAIFACRASSSSPISLSNNDLVYEHSFVAPALVSQLESRGGIKLRILPLGASIVFGASATDGNGFRLGLETALVANGYDVDMVGTRRGGTMLDNECEGWSGFRIEEVATKFDLALPVIAPPNIVLIHVGNNDLTQNFKVATMHERMSSLVDRICVALPSALVIVSTLLPNRNVEAGVETYNANLRGVVDAQSKKGRHVYLADVHTLEFSLNDILPDGTHPNDSGYAKMARVFASKVEEIAGQLGTSSPATTSTPSPPPPSSSTTPPSPPSSTSSSSPPPSPTTTSVEVSSTPGTSTTSITALSTTSSTIPTTEPSTTSSSTLTSIFMTVSESTTSLSTIVNAAASTTSPASTPSASAPAKNGAGSCFGATNLGPTEGLTFQQILVVMACAVPLLAI